MVLLWNTSSVYHVLNQASSILIKVKLALYRWISSLITWDNWLFRCVFDGLVLIFPWVGVYSSSVLFRNDWRKTKRGFRKSNFGGFDQCNARLMEVEQVRMEIWFLELRLKMRVAWMNRRHFLILSRHWPPSNCLNSREKAL